MWNHLRRCLVLCCIQLGVLSCYAQEVGENSEDGTKGFRVTLFNKWEGPELFIKVKKSYVLLEAYKMAYTKTFRYPAGEPVVLYTKQLNDEGKEDYLPYIKIPVSETILEPLLVLYWQAKAKKGSGKVLEFSARKFGYGSYQLVNLSSTKIFGYIGTKKNIFSCNPNTEYISRFSIKNRARTPIAIYISNNNKPDLVFSTLTIHREKKRVILFLHAEENELGRLIYRSQSLVDFKTE